VLMRGVLSGLVASGRVGGGRARSMWGAGVLFGVFVLAAVCVAGVLSAVAGAYATVAPPTRYSSATSLPDGRVYELVSPANKHGYEAGGNLQGSEARYFAASVATADGNAVSFGARGTASETNSSGVNQIFVAQRSSGGWRSRAAMPRGENLTETKTIAILGQQPEWFDFSSDLSHFAFGIEAADVRSAPRDSFANLYLAGPDPFAEPVWLARPVGEEIKLENDISHKISVLGGSPDLSTVYFAYQQPLISGVQMNSGHPWGLYEYRDGALSYAGVLPDGSVDPNGAAPLAITEGRGSGSYSPAATGNQVSADGSRVFFVSPEPESQQAVTPPEMYVRETDPNGRQRTVLVSQSQLPGHAGEPAPHGVGRLATTPPGPRAGGSFRSTDKEADFASMLGYASPDGSHVFFKSSDRLTGEAPEGGGVYDFNVDTGVLEYVAAPGLAGIVTVARDGSSFVFEDSAASPFELDRWSAGPHGGSVTRIAQLPHSEDLCGGVSCVGPARLVDHNNVLVFSAEAPIAGFNDTGSFMQIFRYDFASNELSCVSCPPAGIPPSGDAVLSQPDNYFNFTYIISGTPQYVVADTRGVSADGSRVYFDTPDPLVLRDTNGKRDVYEWENGAVFLISSGSSPDHSLFLDSSESGGDAFFTTTSELVQGDTDLSFDVYDARVPRPGDVLPPESVPCQGDVCQGPPSVPSLLGLPASATFDGLGNVSATVAAPTVKKAVKHKKKLKKKRKGKGRKAAVRSPDGAKRKGRGK
jgi:hypothetical protein